uniref:putative F-box protein At3g10240 n=1 Tax=Erigeron canadensis TaxID=72917 RepID=UPI001CB9B670|nr:putative F-box protein At3g10240 [Erigeron canadensis]
MAIVFMEEILKRLPVKPLAQFRTVSKPWKGLIDSPDFIAAYGVRRPHPDRFILRYIDSSDGWGRYLTFVDNDNDHSFTRQDFVPTVPDLIKTLGSSSVVGSSHGLLCFTGFYEYRNGCLTKMVVVWNPSTSKSIGIEVPYMHNYSPSRVDGVIGFGVCPVTFDPTIVKIEYGFGFPWKVGVFTLSTGTWSILSTKLPRGSIRHLECWSQAVIDRFIYWVAVDLLVDEDDPSKFLIISFDLTAKEFKEINLTANLTNQLSDIQGIFNLRESLVVLANHEEFEEDQLVCYLWMMNEQGITKSFTKLYTIKLPDATVKSLLGFRKNGELILEIEYMYEENAQLEIYSPNSKAINNLGIEGNVDSFFMSSYMETPLLLNQLDGLIYMISGNSPPSKKPRY